MRFPATHFVLMDPSHIQDIGIHGAVITVSTSRTEDEDRSGAMIRQLLTEAGISVVYYALVPDEIPGIRQAVLDALEHANLVIVNGGTGLTHDDCTIEAVTPLLEKIMDGFGELFRLKSYEEIGTRSLLSRAIGGVTGGKAVFCIPGSTGAVTLATSALIIPEIRHILTHASR